MLPERKLQQGYVFLRKCGYFMLINVKCTILWGCEMVRGGNKNGKLQKFFCPCMHHAYQWHTIAFQVLWKEKCKRFRIEFATLTQLFTLSYEGQPLKKIQRHCNTINIDKWHIYTKKFQSWLTKHHAKSLYFFPTKKGSLKIT